ncbi:efflux RND transporter permease subunit [Prochlorothrix hollandica]|uniref:efflux RND transporter permease subunit n=1 Tax=Prochlorothrix hollandica TaxID=1223 RepID=UPI00333F0A5F
MHLSTFSVRNPVPILVGFLILLLGGWFSFGQMGIDDTPNIDVPVVSVTVTQPGAGPTELETQVTKKVEDVVASLDNVDELTSTVRDGISTTTIAFILGTDTDRATNDVRNAVAQIRQTLPQDANEPVVQRLAFAGGAVMSYVVKSDQRSLADLTNLVDRDIGRALLSVKGVAQVQRLGGIDREVRVDLNPDRLLALGITATQVNDQIRAANVDLPAGSAQVASRDRNLRTLGSADTVAQLASLPIVLPQGSTVPLSTLGRVTDDHRDLEQIARFSDGSTASQAPPAVVAFSVFRSTGTSVVTVEEGVRAAVETLNSTLPPDLDLSLIFTQADDPRESYQATIDSLVMGSILTVLVVSLFLRDWRPTLVTATALPLSIIPTFLVMRGLDYTLNGMTLLALALAMGNLVDDAICMVENIDSHLAMGKTPFRAAIDGAREIGLAVVATTATVVGIFTPVAFMGGIPGQFFQPFGFTVSIATLFSTLVAVTITPLMAARLLRSPTLTLGADDLQPSTNRPQLYRWALTWALRHRVISLTLAVLLFWGSLQLVPLIPKGLFGGSDQGLSQMSIELPPGSTLEQTDRISQQVTQQLLANPNVLSVFSEVGERGGEPNKANLTVNLVPKADRAESLWEFEASMRPGFQGIPGARISFISQGAGGGNKDLSIVLRSDNPIALAQSAAELEAAMAAMAGVVDVSSSASLVQPEILIRPNVQRAADLGVSVQSIARTLSLAAIGDGDADLAKFDLADRQIPIRVQVDPDRRNDLDTLKNLQIPSQTGALVPLMAVADVGLGSGPAEINRSDRERQVSIGANLDGVALGDAYAQVQALPIMQNLPAGVSEQPDGDTEIMRDIFSRFAGALGSGVLCIYVILVLLYNSFLTPLAILVALPLSIGGALLALMITQTELGLFALIGIVMLMGLVTKNAILLVDCALANQAAGMPQFRAVIESGVSRLRPILMTTFSTMAGMLPIALGLGAGGEVRSPMAIAVIGGFTTSTLLTLVVVPVLFTYIDSFQYRLLHGFQGRPTGDRPGALPPTATPEPEAKTPVAF